MVVLYCLMPKEALPGGLFPVYTKEEPPRVGEEGGVSSLLCLPGYPRGIYASLHARYRVPSRVQCSLPG